MSTYFTEDFTLSWPCGCHQKNAVNPEKNVPIWLAITSTAAVILVGTTMASHWAQRKKRRRNSRREGWIHLKDSAVRPFEPWETQILVLMYGWAPRQHISLTYKASVKMSGTGGRGSLAKGERGWMPGQSSLPTLCVALKPSPSPFTLYMFYLLQCSKSLFYFSTLASIKVQFLTLISLPLMHRLSTWYRMLSMLYAVVCVGIGRQMWMTRSKALMWCNAGEVCTAVCILTSLVL